MDRVKVIFWGTRGSSPVIGPTPGLFRSNHSPCVELRANGDSIILDAGSALGPAIRDSYYQGKRNFSICLSHFHWDHILGFISIYDLFYQGVNFTIYSADEKAEQHVTTLFHHAYCPIDPKKIASCFKFVHVKKEMELGKFKVNFGQVPHTGKTFAIEVSEGKKRIIYMSDVNLTELKESPFHNGADLLICDSFNLIADAKLRSDWGHSSAEQAAQFALRTQVSKLALFHYDPHYSEAQINRLIVEAHEAAPGLAIHPAQDNDSLEI